MVEWSMDALFCEFYPNPGDRMAFYDALTPEVNLRLDLGTPIAEVVADVAAQHPEHTEALHAWRDRWIETIPGVIEGTQTVIQRCRAAGLAVIGCSNFSRETFQLTEQKYPVFGDFTDIVLSGDHGIAKPDPAIFAIVEQRNGLRPDEIVFFDDAERNVAAAQEHGWNANVFTTATAAATTLAALGVIT